MVILFLSYFKFQGFFIQTFYFISRINVCILAWIYNLSRCLFNHKSYGNSYLSLLVWSHMYATLMGFLICVSSCSAQPTIIPWRNTLSWGKELNLWNKIDIWDLFLKVISYICPLFPAMTEMCIDEKEGETLWLHPFLSSHILFSSLCLNILKACWAALLKLQVTTNNYAS